jgi:hypothetical protein
MIGMESLMSILAGKNVDEPTEVTALRAYLKKHFDFPVDFKIGYNGVTLTVTNGKVATLVRVKAPEMTRMCGLTKKVYVRVK